MRVLKRRSMLAAFAVMTMLIGPLPLGEARTAREGTILVGRETADDRTAYFTMTGDGRKVGSLSLDGDVLWVSRSPDGRRIVYQKLISDPLAGIPYGYMARQYALFVADADGSNEQQLTDASQNIWGPTWAPDGKTILYYRFYSPATYDGELWTIGADGSGAAPLRAVPDPDVEWFGKFSPDGERIALVQINRAWWETDGYYVQTGMTQPSWHIYVMDADGSNLRKLADLDQDLWVVWFNWSPDGRTIVFDALDVGDNDRWKLYTIRSDGTKLRRLIPNFEGDAYFPDYSPDGEQIVFASDRDGDGEVFTLRLRDGKVRQLTDNTVSDYPADWI